jgi:hypothetical protein
MMSQSERRHSQELRSILSDTRRIGIEGAILSAQEAFLRDSTGHLIGQPDGLIWDVQRQLYVVEYKQSHLRRDRAIEQLEIARDAMKYLFGIDPKLLYVHDRNCVERIK